MTKEQRRLYNQRKHAAARQEEAVRRGRSGPAELWWDQARAVAAQQAEEDGGAAWDDLARWLENYCRRYGL